MQYQITVNSFYAFYALMPSVSLKINSISLFQHSDCNQLVLEQVFKDRPDDPWLLKFPPKNTGEHWAEKIAETICSLLDIEHATVKLAEYSNIQVSISKNFVKNCTLYHGNDFLPFSNKIRRG